LHQDVSFVLGSVAATALLAVATPAAAKLDLSTYSVALQTGLDFDEASGVTCNWDKNSLSSSTKRATMPKIIRWPAGVSPQTSSSRTTAISRASPVSAAAVRPRGRAHRDAGADQFGQHDDDRRRTLDHPYNGTNQAKKYSIKGGANIGDNGLEGVSYGPPYAVWDVATGADIDFSVVGAHMGLANVACDGICGYRSATPSFPRFWPRGMIPAGTVFVKGSSMPIGTVKFFNEDKGYGFISPDGGGTDSFVHISAVERAGMTTLLRDQRVTYEVEADRSGKMAAINLQPA
jgi:CspA family cold shock protein